MNNSTRSAGVYGEFSFFQNLRCCLSLGFKNFFFTMFLFCSSYKHGVLLFITKTKICGSEVHIDEITSYSTLKF